MKAGSRANVASSFTVVKGAMIDETYADFAEWERRQLHSAAREFWCRQYPRPPARLALAMDYPPPTSRSFAGASFARYLDSRPLRAFCRERDCTLFTLLLSAFFCTLRRLGGPAFALRDHGLKGRGLGLDDSLSQAAVAGQTLAAQALMGEVRGAVPAFGIQEKAQGGGRQEAANLQFRGRRALGDMDHLQ